MEKNILHDTGSSAFFVTHRTAQQLDFEIVDALKLTIKTMADPVVLDTFVYKGKLFNFDKGRNEDVYFHGANTIG